MAPGSSTTAYRVSQPARNDQGKPREDNYYRAFMKVYLDQVNFEVVVRFHKTNICRVKPNGDITLTTGSWYTATTQAAMNDALGPIGFKVGNTGHVGAQRWYVLDPQGNQTPYSDGLVIPGTGSAADRERGRLVAAAFNVDIPAAAARPTGPRTAAMPAPRRTGPQTAAAGAAAAPGGRPAAAAAAPAAPAWRNGLTAAERIKAAAGAFPASGGTFAQLAAGGGGAANAAAAGPQKSVQEQLAQLIQDLDMEQDLEDEHLCVICMHQPRDTVLVPCGHMVLCNGCCTDIKGKAGSGGAEAECPVCRMSIADTCQINPDDY